MWKGKLKVSVHTKREEKREIEREIKRTRERKDATKLVVIIVIYNEANIIYIR
jgi:hypothetical protein